MGIGGSTAMTSVPELSRRIGHPSGVVAVGQEVSAEILDVGMMRERVPLSLKALQDDPMARPVQRAGHVVTGAVTVLVPFGVFVRVEDREDGPEGLLPSAELSEEPVAHPGDVVQAGASLVVRIPDVAPVRRRIALSRLQALAHGGA